MPKAVLISFLLTATSLAASDSLSSKERKEGFESLFDGTNLARWHSVTLRPDAGHWFIRDHTLSWDKGGTWLSTDNTYYDFVLRLEYRTGADSNSGIFLRSKADGNPAFSGMELQILSDHAKPVGVHSTGALYGAAAPSRNMAKPPGHWNHVEVTLIGRSLEAVWNGVKVIDLSLDDPAFAKAQNGALSERAEYGFIGLQAYAKGDPVEFRRIRLKPIKIGPPVAGKVPPMPKEP